MKELLREFPVSSWRLLDVLLAIDPANRGSASSALQDEFFHTSPLAFDLSELPVVTVRHETPQHSQSQRESKTSKPDAEKAKPDNDGSNEETMKSRVLTVFSLEPGSSTTNNKYMLH